MTELCLASSDNCQVPRNKGGIHLLVNVSGPGLVIAGIARPDDRSEARMRATTTQGRKARN